MFFALLSVLFSLAQAQNSNGTAGFVVAIDSATDFCLIIPKDSGTDIAKTETTAVAGCWGNPVDAKPAKELPPGFITSAHYVETEVYRQVTGTYNPLAYNLDPLDQGTQWDNSLASKGGVMPWSGCAGHPQYIEMFGAGVYCLRCCNYAYSNYCNPSNDTLGCFRTMVANYGPGFTNVRGASPEPPKPVVNYQDCSPMTDTCLTSGFACCLIPGLSGENATKTTCQPLSGCVPDSIPTSGPKSFGSSTPTVATLSFSPSAVTISTTVSLSTGSVGSRVTVSASPSITNKPPSSGAFKESFTPLLMLMIGLIYL